MRTCPICYAARRLCPQCSGRFFHERIVQARQARGYSSRRAFARAAGLSYRLLSSWERGRVRPSEEDLDGLCRVLAVPRLFFARPAYLPEPFALGPYLVG